MEAENMDGLVKEAGDYYLSHWTAEKLVNLEINRLRSDLQKLKISKLY
jgi:hypothetical protein